MKFGSVCSGIDAASVALAPAGFKAAWFSETEDFPSRVLRHHYADVENHGDMLGLPNLIAGNSIEAPDIICGGTPCQAFSLAGVKRGLNDERAQLTLNFIETANAADKIRRESGKKATVILWENVEGVLSDKTNAFGIFVSTLAGIKEPLAPPKWMPAGFLCGPERNVAWRVLDAKYFGLPQQRRRLFVLATDIKIDPKSILFETTRSRERIIAEKNELYGNSRARHGESLFDVNPAKMNGKTTKIIKGNKFEIFRGYTDCVYAAYGTKWNGNAAAYNGSLYVAQNERVRRFTPLECERLMGLPDEYTNLLNTKDTQRYKSVGNSWAVPVVNWLGIQIRKNLSSKTINTGEVAIEAQSGDGWELSMFKNDFVLLKSGRYLNISVSPNNPVKGDIFAVVEDAKSSKYYLSSKGTDGILRRKNEHSINMNNRLECLFKKNK